MESVNNSGTFADISCPRLLVHLHLARFTGTLRISQGAVLKLLYFQTGEIAMASSNDQGDHLAPILMRAGKLKAEQLELARKQARPGTSLARILVQMGFLTSGELFSGARQQLRQIVGSVLYITEGRYEIQSDYFPRELTSLNVETRELLLDLILDLPERSFVLLEVGAPDTSYSPASAPLPEATPPTLPRRWRDYADRFSGPMTIHAFGQAAGLDDFAASKAVYGLHLFGLLEPETVGPEGVALPAEASALSLETALGMDSVSGPVTAAAEIPEPERQAVIPLRSEPVEAANQSEVASGIVPALEEGAPIPIHPLDNVVPERAVEAAPAPAPWAPAEKAGEGEEIIAQGEPIRLEFKGPLSSPPPPGRSAGPWGILSIMAGIAILIAAFAWFVFLKGSAPAAISPASTETAAQVPESGTAEAGPAPVPGATQTGGAAEGSGQVPPDDPSPAESTGPATPRAAAPPSAADTRELAEAVAPIPGDADKPASEEPPGPLPQPGSGPVSRPIGDSAPPVVPATSVSAVERISGVPPFTATDRFFEARTRLDAGDFAAAAGTWFETVRQEKKNAFTLQIAIACQEESVKKAARRTRGSVDFFTVPISLQDRACYRLCWGAYSSQEEAQAAKGTVPAFFLDEGGKPVVVGLGKLAPPERR